jgi:hypothetical protein
MGQVRRIDLDSEALGFPVFEIAAPDSVLALIEANAELSRVTSKYYAYCKVEAKDISLIHAAENLGFQYVETQLQTSLGLKKTFDTSRYPYSYIRVTSASQLYEVFDIASSALDIDRLTADPLIGAALSQKRYQSYLENSYVQDDSEIWCVVSRSTGKILTFRSHRRIDESNVQLLLGGVDRRHANIGLGVISSHFCFNQLRAAGYKRARTAISASNRAIIQLELGHFGFRVDSVQVVLRKFQHQ